MYKSIPYSVDIFTYIPVPQLIWTNHIEIYLLFFLEKMA